MIQNNIITKQFCRCSFEQLQKNIKKAVTYSIEVTNALKRLRDDLKEWTTNNILSLKTYVDKTKFSGSYNDLTNKPNIPSIEGLATEELVNNLNNDVVENINEIYDEDEYSNKR